MSEPLSAERLAEIRARAAKSKALPWGQFESDLVAIASEDVPDLLAEVDRLAAENARLQVPSCGGPDCRMTELHTVNTCPTHAERAIKFVSDDDRHGTDPAWDGTGE